MLNKLKVYFKERKLCSYADCNNIKKHKIHSFKNTRKGFKKYSFKVCHSCYKEYRYISDQ